jgi:hypothetical protein
MDPAEVLAGEPRASGAAAATAPDAANWLAHPQPEEKPHAALHAFLHLIEQQVERGEVYQPGEPSPMDDEPDTDASDIEVTR